MAQVNSPVVLITGASRGIGAACARRLADDGLAIAINTYPEPSMQLAAEQVAADIRGNGGIAAVYSADISDSHSVAWMFDRCETDLGPVYGLVLNAATTTRGPWTELTEDEWDRVFAVNLKGAFLCCQRAFGKRDARQQGVIVAIGSILARLGSPESVHYASSKAGLVGFTRSLARALGPQGVRVNCVVPGAIQTEEEREAFPDSEETSKSVLPKQCLQRRGTAEDVAGLVSFLLGPDSSFISGQSICIDGGWT